MNSCDTCGLSFPTTRDLFDHIREVHMTESPQFRAARTRTPEEDRAVKLAVARRDGVTIQYHVKGGRWVNAHVPPF